jgi:hypothetical protein
VTVATEFTAVVEVDMAGTTTAVVDVTTVFDVAVFAVTVAVVTVAICVRTGT